MIDYDKAIANINKPLLEINKDIEFYENRIKELTIKRDYIKNKKTKSKSIINKIISGEIQSPSKKQKLTTKHPENINSRISSLIKNISIVYTNIKELETIRNTKYPWFDYYKSDEQKQINLLYKSLYRYKTKLNRYLQIRNKLDKGE